MLSMKKLIMRSLAILCCTSFLLVFSACEDQGPAEKAGEEIDETMEKTGDVLEDAGDKVKEAVEEGGEKLEEAGEKIQE